MKRILSLVLTLIMLAGLVVLPVSAASEETVIQTVGLIGILTGDASGNLNLEKPVTRAEFTKMVVCASTLKDQSSATSAVAPFPDVRGTHWAAGYIATAVSSGWVNGYRNGRFLPENPVTLEEAVNITLKLLGYTASDFSGTYPDAQLTKYRALELSEGVSALKGEAMTRRNCMYLLYNALNAETKEGKTYCETLGYATDKDGNIDTLKLINDTLKGPIIVKDSGWVSALPFALDRATVYRSGVKSSPDRITTYDVVYYSEGLRTLWVYTDKVTGILESASPSLIAPESVTLSGKAYQLSGEGAQALSSFGDVKLGDTVTLLLGKDGTVVGTATGAGQVGESYGVIVAITTREYTQPDGKTYTTDVLQILDTTGVLTDYPYNAKYFSVGGIVRVTHGETVKITGLTNQSLTGSIDSKGSGIGSRKFSENVEILDVCEGKGVRVYPSRLAGVTLDTKDVAYYTLDSAGEITRLILRDVTGDLDQYGVITEIAKTESDYAASYIYTYDLGGVQGKLSNVRASGIITVGGFAKREMLDGTTRITSLKQVLLSSIGDTSATAGNVTYPVAPSVVVYIVRSGEYYISNLSAVQSGYKLTGYYDTPAREGGRIRVVVAVKE